jgi:hypothetical protein
MTYTIHCIVLCHAPLFSMIFPLCSFSFRVTFSPKGQANVALADGVGHPGGSFKPRTCTIKANHWAWASGYVHPTTLSRPLGACCPGLIGYYIKHSLSRVPSRQQCAGLKTVAAVSDSRMHGSAGFQPALRPISAGWKPALPENVETRVRRSESAATANQDTTFAAWGSLALIDAGEAVAWLKWPLGHRVFAQRDPKVPFLKPSKKVRYSVVIGLECSPPRRAALQTYVRKCRVHDSEYPCVPTRH